MKKVSYILTILVISMLFLVSCEPNVTAPPEDNSQIAQLDKKAAKVKLQHLKGNGEYVIIEVNQNAVAAHLAHGDKIICDPDYHQGFENNTDGWSDANDSWYGTVTRVSSGTDGISSSTGEWHAVFEGDATSAPFTRFDGYSDTWPGTWRAEIDVYLDPSWTLGQGFDYSVAATGSDGAHQRDYIFHVNKDISTEKLLVAGSNNTNFEPREDLENIINHYEVTSAGWYTLQHVFYDNGGALAVDLKLLDINGNVLFTETRFNATDLIPSVVGGNRYGWFTFINVDGGIAVDETELFRNCQ